jgi:UDP-glucose 4-epimerase
MNVLVTGGAGYVGSVCAEELIRARHRVVVVDDLSTGHRNAVPEGACFVKVDIADRARLRWIIRRHSIDSVMHFAGATLVERSMTEPRYYFQNNVQKGLMFLETLLEQEVKNFIFSSTAAVYGEPVSTPITEDHPTMPINAYGESKLMLETILEWYHRAYGLNCVALRYFNAAGASERLGEDHRPETHLLPLLLEAASDSNKSFQIFGDDYPTPDGTCMRDFVHVRDIAQAHILALRALPKLGFRIYNVGHGRGYSIRDVVKAVEGTTSRELPIRVGQRRPGDPAVLVASPQKLCRELKWKPRYSGLPAIVRSAWAWRLRHPDGYRGRR